jgi:hypothetical protein
MVGMPVPVPVAELSVVYPFIFEIVVRIPVKARIFVVIFLYFVILHK